MNAKRTATHIFPWFICGLGALFYCYEYLLRISPSVMTHELMQTFHLTGAQVGNLSAFFYHAYVPMQIAVGLLMDKYGPRNLLTIACLLCVIGTILFASSHCLWVAQSGRFLIGLGSAFAFVGAFKIATIWLPPNRFALVSGLIICLGMIGAMVGDMLLRRLIDLLGWQNTMFVAAGMGLVLAVFLWKLIKNPWSQQQKQSICFRELWFGLFVSVINPQIWINTFVGFLLFLSLPIFAEMWGIPYLMQAHYLSKTQAADANAMVFLGWAVGSPFWGWFSDYVKSRRQPILWGSIVALMIFCIILYSDISTLWMLKIFLFLFGFFSGVQILIFPICREVSATKFVGTAIALTNMLVMFGGNVFPPLVGKILDWQWQGALLNGARVYSAHAFTQALSIVPLCILLAIILATCFLCETYKMQATHDVV